MTMNATGKQIVMEAKVSRFLLRSRTSKVHKPYLVDAIVSKLERAEGVTIPARIYTRQTKASR